MKINDLLTKLNGVYNKLDEGFYTFADYPAQDEKVLQNQPSVSENTLEELREIIGDLDELMQGSGLTSEILELTDEDTPISDLIKFDTQEVAMDLINENPDAYDENMSSAQEAAMQSAHEQESELYDAAIEDIKRLMEALLPQLLLVEA
ncbi:hypothetical protein COJ90_21775 [Priestia megaterium]|uniref:hypothetical protein n=1 Tax=Priestia megaterium TaxID=1404 RepID=UPI000BF7AF60|nr:hypothetical protein [Priestia megaterium]PFP08565.1 hypothetical protein COJ90_21775 [Priestia megaterium]